MIEKSWKGTPIITGPAEALTLIDTRTSIHMELFMTLLRMVIIAGTIGILMMKIEVIRDHLAQAESQGVGLILTTGGMTTILIGLEQFGEVEINIPGINMRAQAIEAKIRVTRTMTKILIKPGECEMKEEIIAAVLMITGMIADPLVRNLEYMVKIQF